MPMTPAGLLRLQRDEGLRLKPYADAFGHLSIGYGRNLDAEGITVAEAGVLLASDLAQREAALAEHPWFLHLDPVRKDVVLNVAFNVGFAGLLGFARMILALEGKDFDGAATELLDSDAARELPLRYQRLALALRSGAWPDQSPRVALTVPYL